MKQSQKDDACMIPLQWVPEAAEFTEAEGTGWVPGAGELVFNGDKVSVWEDERFLGTEEW